MKKACLLTTLCGLFAIQAFSQGSATISGVVVDPSGAVLPGARVVIAETGTGLSRELETGEDGRFVANALRPAQYTITTSITSFKTDVIQVTLLADQNRSLQISLDLGETVQTVTVVSETVSPDFATPTLSQVIEEKRIVELPLDGRNAATLTLLVGGAVEAPSNGIDQGNTKTFPGAQTNAIHGARANMVSYNLDGANNNDIYTDVNAPFPFPDALQEFSVQTSNYKAEFGQNAGAVVNAHTKSGTNDVHGTLFGFHRNGALNARNFFASQTDPLKRTQYGGTIGGPVIKNRTFFFAGYQGTRIRSVQNGLSSFVPTDANRGGDFSALLDANSPNNPVGKAVQVIDPVSRTPFANNLIPQSRLDPSIQNFLDYIPNAGGNGRVIYNRRIRQEYDEVVTRIDHEFSEKDRISGRYFFDRFKNASAYDGSDLLKLTGFSDIRYDNFGFTHTHIQGPSLINELYLTLSRDRNMRGQPDGVPSVTDFGVQISQPQGAPSAIESVNASGFFSVGANTQAAFPRVVTEVRDNVRWTKGSHSISFGGQFQTAHIVIRNFFQAYGQFSFTNDITGNALASMMMGKLRTFKQGDRDFKDAFNVFPSLYIQDTWKVNSKLSLDYGVRWDPLIPWNETKGRAAQFRPDAYYAGQTSQVYPNAPPGLFYPGDAGFPNSGSGTSRDLNNFGPRAGFAYALGNSSKTVIRGGGGVFYQARIAAISNNRFEILTPFSTQITQTDPQGGFTNPWQGTGISPDFFPRPFPASSDAPFPRPVLAVTFDPSKKFVTPTIYQWNLTFERQLSTDTLLRLAYVGSHSSFLSNNIELNNAVYIPGSTLGSDARRRFQQFSSIQMMSNAANSSFNALEVGVEKRAGSASGPAFLRKITLLANYTFSKSLDTMGLGQDSNTTGVSAKGPVPFDDPRYGPFNTGPSDFNHAHRMVLSYVWDLPSLANAAPAVRWIFGSWQASGVYQVQTGAPLTIEAGKDQSLTALGGDRAVFLGNADELGTGSRGPGGCRAGEAPCVDFLDPSKFALPGVGQYGNVGKGAFTGPMLTTWNMGFFKNIPIRERIRMQFRWEMFNAFNHTNFNAPTTSVSSGGFGGIRGSGDPRINQVALKVTF
ncbi:MAG: carboxypeptidase regulatory-like domain-containing protein [Acidobacteria bacterium]|nr:carboxypeptidase regulatory-like domain-containing protein [Acidobacteriota bacterium]